ncbi:HTH_38 domain-containing protein [Trichonephila clavipes]|nr:HTH_38 domain-containing protein [Trichonephila clavipes]
MSRRKQQSAFDQISEFDRERIVAYRDCGLSFRRYDGPMWSIASTSVHHFTLGQAVMDRSVTSRTVAQHIMSVTHHSVSALTIRRRLQQSGLSARRPLLGLSTLDAEPQTSPPPMVR